MTTAIHYYRQASVSKELARVRVRHIAAPSLINSQDR
jgi:hypothetical protein